MYPVRQGTSVKDRCILQRFIIGMEKKQSEKKYMFSWEHRLFPFTAGSRERKFEPEGLRTVSGCCGRFSVGGPLFLLNGCIPGRQAEPSLFSRPYIDASRLTFPRSTSVFLYDLQDYRLIVIVIAISCIVSTQSAFSLVVHVFC